jgi:AmiR/NasT family two-component response regulator
MTTTTPDRAHVSPHLLAAHEEIAQLRVALMTRGVIDQAKGILMAQTGCTADDAFDMLRAASMRDNRKLHDVAVRIVASVVTRARRPGGGRDGL